MHAGLNSGWQPSKFSNFAHTRITTLGSLLHRVRSGTAAAEKRDDRPENIVDFIPWIFLKSPQTDLLFPNILVFFGYRKDLIRFLGPIDIIKPVYRPLTKDKLASTPYISVHVVQIYSHWILTNDQNKRNFVFSAHQSLNLDCWTLKSFLIK